VNSDLSILHLVMGASPLVQAVLVALLLASILSWTAILQKRKVLRRARLAADAFEDRFWSGTDLGAIYQQLGRRNHDLAGMERIFEAGFKEFMRLHKQSGAEARAMVEGAQRAMRVVLSREVDELEAQLPFLATVGSTSPYVGLFGTVWGIMNAFQNLGGVKQATIAHVAPGIAEALVATAMGLFAAIPAVIAYNRYATALDRLVNRYENFMEEFSTILQRHALSRRRDSAAASGPALSQTAEQA
jgi:biopolymer transport protein TolQ